jgi:hypothetical protein
MKNLKFSILLIIISIISYCLILKANTPKTKKLRHVVAFKFKPHITTEQMQKATADFST